MLLKLRLEIAALSSTWVVCLESSWCKLFAGQCGIPWVVASLLKLLLSIAMACLVYTKLGIVGAAVDVAGCCSTSKLGSYALSSSICCTLLLEVAHGVFPRKFHDNQIWKIRKFDCQKFCCHFGGSCKPFPWLFQIHFHYVIGAAFA